MRWSRRCAAHPRRRCRTKRSSCRAPVRRRTKTHRVGGRTGPTLAVPLAIARSTLPRRPRSYARSLSGACALCKLRTDVRRHKGVFAAPTGGNAIGIGARCYIDVSPVALASVQLGPQLKREPLGGAFAIGFDSVIRRSMAILVLVSAPVWIAHAQNPLVDADSVVLERTGCLGPCPLYVLHVSRSGAVLFESRSHRDEVRREKDTIPAYKFQRILAQAVLVDF